MRRCQIVSLRMMTKKRNVYHNKQPLSTFHPDQRHWTRSGNSWKQKVSYNSEDDACEFLEQNPRLKSLGYRVYLCLLCNKWHVGHEH